MQQSGQSGPHRAAQVTQQAVGEGGHFLRSFPPTPAPLIHQPKKIYMDSVSHLSARMDSQLTHRKNESSRESAEREPRPTDTQGWPASRDRQVDTEDTQNSTRPERTVAGCPPTSARSSMLDVFARRVHGTSSGASWSHQGRSSCVTSVNRVVRL